MSLLFLITELPSLQIGLRSAQIQRGSAQVVLRNPQLINGGQTAYTLARIYEACVEADDFRVFTGKEVLLRVITLVGLPASRQEARLNLIEAISKASNSQTKIEESDRRSNDAVQVRLQDEFFEKYGLYYERKRGEFSDGLRDRYLSADLVVNREGLFELPLPANTMSIRLGLAFLSFSRQARSLLC
jgi:hypothetical protein